MHYGFYSGYKINIEKTTVGEINGIIPGKTKVQSELNWSKDSIKHLEMYIPISLDNLFDQNNSVYQK